MTLTEQAAPPPPAPLTNQLRQLQLADRSNYDRATRAFVSFVQAYAKHECRLIFSVKGTDQRLLYSGRMSLPTG